MACSLLLISCSWWPRRISCDWVALFALPPSLSFHERGVSQFLKFYLKLLLLFLLFVIHHLLHTGCFYHHWGQSSNHWAVCGLWSGFVTSFATIVDNFELLCGSYVLYVWILLHVVNIMYHKFITCFSECVSRVLHEDLIKSVSFV